MSVASWILCCNTLHGRSKCIKVSSVVCPKSKCCRHVACTFFDWLLSVIALTKFEFFFLNRVYTYSICKHVNFKVILGVGNIDIYTCKFISQIVTY